MDTMSDEAKSPAAAAPAPAPAPAEHCRDVNLSTLMFIGLMAGGLLVGGIIGGLVSSAVRNRSPMVSGDMSGGQGSV